ncbi:hypothetical protein [Modicisalibacter xianhensis]|nr:hypothetical protein [Halomonas xianhensis]
MSDYRQCSECEKQIDMEHEGVSTSMDRILCLECQCKNKLLEGERIPE